MIVRYAETSPATITEFGCSACRWTFLIESPAPGPIRAELLESAEKAYDVHACPGDSAVPADCNVAAETAPFPLWKTSKMVN